MPRLTPPVGDRDHATGPRDARVTFVEYGDFQCPACGAAHRAVKQLRERLSDHVRFVFRHFPLSDVHPRAERAAAAAEAAARQGKFWEMHDLLFERQGVLEDDVLLGFAASLDLDVEKFRADLDDPATLARVREGFASGLRSGVNGTPTFFINGARHEGAHGVGALWSALSRATAA